MGYRSTSITFSFAVVFLLIAILARATALTTQGPWFSPSVSAQFYAVTLLAGTLLAFGLAALASHRTSQLDTSLRAADWEVEMLDRIAASGTGGGEDSNPLPGGSSELDALLGQLETVEAGGTTATGKVGHDSIIEVSRVHQRASVVGKQELRQSLVKQRESIRFARDRVWPSVIGPVSLAIFFVAVSGSMLPGAEVFLVDQFQLNTMLVLTLAYSWWLLVAWAVLAVALLPTDWTHTKVFRPRLFERVE